MANAFLLDAILQDVFLLDDFFEYNLKMGLVGELGHPTEPHLESSNTRDKDLCRSECEGSQHTEATGELLAPAIQRRCQTKYVSISGATRQKTKAA